jgi:hypothetical protein
MTTKCAAVVIASFLAIVLIAQTPTATLVGRIVDATGSVVPGAAIQVREAETNKTRTAESQVDGGYTISNLPPGLYEVTIDKPGFRRLVENRLELRVAQTARLDAQLEIGRRVSLSSWTPAFLCSTLRTPLAATSLSIMR